MYTLYMNLKKRIIAALCAAALFLPLSGCDGSIYDNYREVDSLQVVQTIGIDKTSEGVRLSISSRAGTDNLPAVVMSRDGAGIVSAMESLQDYSAKEELFFSHTRYALLGEESAACQLEEFLDYIERNTHIRMDTIPFVTRGGKAEALVTLSGKKTTSVTETLSSVERDIKHSGESYPFSCREIARSLSEYGGALIGAVAGKKTEGAIFTESGELTVIPVGYGIIKEGRLVGYLDHDGARGANVLTDRFGFGSIYLKLSDEMRVILLPDSSSAELIATFDDSGMLRQLLVEAEISTGISEMSVPIDFFQDDNMQVLTAALSKEVQGWCLEALGRCLETECDFMGLFGLLQMQYPKEMENLSEDFIGALKNAEISVRVNGKVKQSYNLDAPLSVTGRETGNAKK